MSLQTELMEMGKSKLTQMKMFLDDLEVQLALGKAEAKDTLEKERKNVQHFVRDQKSRFKEMTETTGNHRNKLTQTCQHLQAQLSKEAANKKQFDAWQKATLHAIYELEAAMKDAWGAVGLGLQSRLEDLKDRLDTFRIRLALGSFESLEQQQAAREDLAATLDETLDKMTKESKTGEKIDLFSEEMGASFDHMKKAFSELLS